MKASDSPYRKLDWVSTGYANLDKILGGGIPSRKIVEISGQNGVGKSTLASSIISQFQQAKKAVCLVDTEFSLETYEHVNEIDLDKLDLISEKIAEDNLDQAEEWLEKHKNALLVLDSIGGLLTRAEAEKNADGKVIGGQAKVIATFCRKIVPILAINNNSLIVLNHEFTDLMSGKLMTSGGAKLAYHKSIWLRLKKMNKRVMQGENQVGDIVEAEIRKHKVAPTLKQSCELTLLYGKGFAKGMDVMQDALDKGVIEKKGSSFFFKGEKVAYGLPKLRELMKDESFAAKLSDATKGTA